MILINTRSGSRPKLKIELTQFDRFVEVSGWVALCLFWFLVIWNFSDLPGSIPSHFGASGEPDSFGSRNTIFILPAIGTAIFIGLTILNRYPHIFNYPGPITEKNALQQYTNATRLIRFLKLAILLIFMITGYKTIQVAKGVTKGLGIWFLPLTLGIVFIPFAFFVIRSIRNKFR